MFKTGKVFFSIIDSYSSLSSSTWVCHTLTTCKVWNSSSQIMCCLFQDSFVSNISWPVYFAESSSAMMFPVVPRFILLALVVMFCCLSTVVRAAVDDDELAGFPERPNVFRSPEELKEYLRALNEYFAIAGRPRYDITVRSNAIYCTGRI